MIVIAVSLYLPSHITTIASRAWFYYAGDESTAGDTVGLQDIGKDTGGGNDAIDILGRQ